MKEMIRQQNVLGKLPDPDFLSALCMVDNWKNFFESHGDEFFTLISDPTLTNGDISETCAEWTEIEFEEDSEKSMFSQRDFMSALVSLRFVAQKGLLFEVRNDLCDVLGEAALCEDNPSSAFRPPAPFCCFSYGLNGRGIRINGSGGYLGILNAIYIREWAAGSVPDGTNSFVEETHGDCEITRVYEINLVTNVENDPWNRVRSTLMVVVKDALTLRSLTDVVRSQMDDYLAKGAFSQIEYNAYTFSLDILSKTLLYLHSPGAECIQKDPKNSLKNKMQEKKSGKNKDNSVEFKRTLPYLLVGYRNADELQGLTNGEINSL